MNNAIKKSVPTMYYSFSESRMHQLEEVGIFNLMVSFFELQSQNRTEALIDFHEDNPHVHLVIEMGGTRELQTLASEKKISIYDLPAYKFQLNGFAKYLQRCYRMFDFVIAPSFDTSLNEYMEYTAVSTAKLEAVVGAQKLCPVWKKHQRVATWDLLCDAEYQHLAIERGEATEIRRKINSAHNHGKKVHFLNATSPEEMGTSINIDSFSSGYWRSGNKFSKIYTVHRGCFEEVPKAGVDKLLEDPDWLSWFHNNFSLFVDKVDLNDGNQVALDMYNAVVWKGYLDGTCIPNRKEAADKAVASTSNSSCIKVDHEGRVLRYALVETQQGDIIRRNALIPDSVTFMELAAAPFTSKVEKDLTLPATTDGNLPATAGEVMEAKKYEKFAQRKALVMLKDRGNAVELTCNICEMREACPKFEDGARCSYVFGTNQEMQMNDTLDILSQQHLLASDTLKLVMRGVTENTALDGGKYDPNLVKTLNQVFELLSKLREAHGTELQGKQKKSDAENPANKGVFGTLLVELATSAKNKANQVTVSGDVDDE